MEPAQEEGTLRAAGLIREARSLLVTAGAGMGVDSGLPDFRGDDGFWNAYPPYRKLGLGFVSMANPDHFARDPAFAWGFYGHRLELYRKTVPHAGFGILLSWEERLSLRSFVVTSNVDGQFQKAGFSSERIWEVHGSIHHAQCLRGCNDAIFPMDDEVLVDASTMRAERVPVCPRCGGVARPNILMFGDAYWQEDRSAAQEGRFETWYATTTRPLVVVELGAGSHVPTIRRIGTSLGSRSGARVVRINPREAEIETPHVSVEAGALAGLLAIDRELFGAGSPS